MTFFEGFLYAIAPLMAFAVALGPVGIAMVGKYLLFGLWIQLWLPIMAVINLYLHMAIGRDMAALEGSRSSLSSSSRCRAKRLLLRPLRRRINASRTRNKSRASIR
jgi:hypothetical protein